MKISDEYYIYTAQDIKWTSKLDAVWNEHSGCTVAVNDKLELNGTQWNRIKSIFYSSGRNEYDLKNMESDKMTAMKLKLFSHSRLHQSHLDSLFWKWQQSRLLYLKEQPKCFNRTRLIQHTASTLWQALLIGDATVFLFLKTNRSYWRVR